MKNLLLSALIVFTIFFSVHPKTHTYDDLNVAVVDLDTIGLYSHRKPLEEIIESEFDDNDTVIVIGFWQGVVQSEFGLNLTIPEGKTVVWKAMLFFDIVSITLGGSGTFELAEDAYISMRAGHDYSNRSVIEYTADSNVTLNITGGGIVSRSKNAIINNTNDNCKINISGGAIYSMNRDLSFPIVNSGSGSQTNITGGIVFRYGTTAVATSTPANTTIGGSGVVIAWQLQNDHMSYEDGTRTHIVSNPPNSARWSFAKQGIVNDKNNEVFLVAFSDVSVTPPPIEVISIVNGKVELRNNTDEFISTKGLYLTDGTKRWALPAVLVRAGETVTIGKKRGWIDLTEIEELWLYRKT